MKKIMIMIILSAALAHSAAALAAEINFKDGTLVRGDFQGETLRVKTNFGELQPKISQMLYVSAGKIELQDGSQVMGELLPPAADEDSAKTAAEGVLFKTKYGVIELIFTMEDIEYIDFKK